MTLRHFTRHISATVLGSLLCRAFLDKFASVGGANIKKRGSVVVVCKFLRTLF